MFLHDSTFVIALALDRDISLKAADNSAKLVKALTHKHTRPWWLAT